MRRPPFFRAYSLEIVKLGLVIGAFTPKPAARPRVKVVLPAPTSPMSSMTLVPLAGSAGFSFLTSQAWWGSSPPKAATRPRRDLANFWP